MPQEDGVMAGMGREHLDSGLFITRTPSPDPRIDKALC